MTEGRGVNANAHTQGREEPVGFTAGHAAAVVAAKRRNARHKETYKQDVTAEAPRRQNVQCDQFHTRPRIDCAHQMKHFTICSFVLPSGFEWKSMIIKLDHQRFVFFSFLVGLATVYAILSSPLITL